MKRFLSLLPAVLVLLLSGCGQGPSISSIFSLDSTNKNSKDSSMRVTETLAQDVASKSVSTVAAATYIFESISREYKLPPGFELALVDQVKHPRDLERSLSTLQQRFHLDEAELSAALVSIAVQPRLGWPFDPMENTKRRAAFISSTQASAELANSVGATIAVQLPATVYKSQEQAEKAILDTFKALDHKAIQEEWIQRVKAFELARVDFASDGNIHFISKDGHDYSADQGGFKYSVAGHSVFGQDVLNSRKVELSFEAGQTATRNMAAMETSSKGSDVSTQRKSSAEVK